MPVVSDEIAHLVLYRTTPLVLRLYALPSAAAYAFLAFAVQYFELGREPAVVAAIALVAVHALLFLSTHWSVAARARIDARPARSLSGASSVRITPPAHRESGELVPLLRLRGLDGELELSFVYQGAKYLYLRPAFQRPSYPADSPTRVASLQSHARVGLPDEAALRAAAGLYGPNVVPVPVPTFTHLFAEHAVAPFFVFQVFCVALWMLDEYWYYSVFSLLMLIVFESTVVFQRLTTLREFRSMALPPSPVWVYRANVWTRISSAELFPGDVVSITRSRDDAGVPCDLLLCSGEAIVNEAMLSGESTPLLKESIALRPPSDMLDAHGSDKSSVLFGGTKVLQIRPGPAAATSDETVPDTPDGGALSIVIRTGFGTTQGGLIRLMVYANQKHVGAGNLETIFFLLFLLAFAIAASAYVWVQGAAMGRPRGKLLLDCVLIITSVVPPELPMELSMAVNASLQSLARSAIFCTEPFRIPYAGKVDVCCFDKTGTITAEQLQLQGVAQIGTGKQPVQHPAALSNKETTLTIASAHALVLLDDDGVVGDPMEKTTVDSLGWAVLKGDVVAPKSLAGRHMVNVQIRRRFQFSSALKRMSTISVVAEAQGSIISKRGFAAVKGAPETLKGMYATVPEGYDDIYKGYTRRGSRVLALGYKWLDTHSHTAINRTTREQVEQGLTFAGFLIFYSPLKPDAAKALMHLNDSNHRCVMITGDNPLTAIHVAEQVEIVDRPTLILDTHEGATEDPNLMLRSVDEQLVINVKPDDPLDEALFEKYDLCLTGSAMHHYEGRPEQWASLVENTWVYARVSPNQKEFVLNSLRSRGYVTLMAGDGTNDVGALKAADVGVALLDGTMQDMEALAEHARLVRIKKAYEGTVTLAVQRKQPPPEVPPMLKAKFPDLERVRDAALAQISAERRTNPSAPFDFSAIAQRMAAFEADDGPPQIRLGDASVAAPFTSKLSNVDSIIRIIRQGRSTLVAFTQMHKILALNCLISAYSLSVLYLHGIKQGDYQSTISGMVLSISFFCVSRAKPNAHLSAERPLTRVFSTYIFLSVLLQFALHCGATHYLVTVLVPIYERPQPVTDLEAKFAPSLLNTVIYLLGLCQQVNTFSVNFIGRPHREALSSNKAMYYGLIGCVCVALAGVVNLIPFLNNWLQLVPIPSRLQLELLTIMVADFAGCYAIEWVIKATTADQRPKPIISKRRQGLRSRRAQRQANFNAIVAGLREREAKVESS